MLKILKKALGITLAASLFVGIAGCTSNNKNDVKADSGTNTEKSQEAVVDNNKELKTVTIATIGTDGTLTELARVAQSGKFFEKRLEEAGYKPEYQGFAQAGPAINEAFAGDSIDVAFYGDLPQISAKNNGVDIKVVASVNSQLDYAVLGANDADIKSVKDLKGKKIAVGFGTVTYKYLDDLLRQNNLSIKDVKVVNTSVDGPAMLGSGQVDAFVTQYAAGVAYQAGGIGRVIFSTKDDEKLAGQLLLAAREKFIESDRKAVTAIVQALYDAYDYAKENPDNVYEQLATKNFPKEIQKQVYTDNTFEAFDPSIDNITIEKLNDIEKFAKDNELISSDVAVDDLVDKSIIDDIKK